MEQDQHSDEYNKLLKKIKAVRNQLERDRKDMVKLGDEGNAQGLRRALYLIDQNIFYK